MPINNSNGNEVSEIVLPNGATASEVIAPDGTTVFSGIPDSLIHQHPLSQGSGSTVTDAIGNADGTINGPSWVDGTWKDGFALESSSGQVEDVDYTHIRDAANITGPWTVIYTIRTTEEGVHLGSSNGGTVSGLIFGGGGFYGGGTSSDTADLGIQSSDGSNLVVHGSTTITDGSKYRIAFTLDGNSAADASIYVNGSEETKDVIRDNNPSSFNNIPPFYWFAENQNGGAANQLAATFDNPKVFDQVRTASEIQQDYNNQPWS